MSAPLVNICKQERNGMAESFAFNEMKNLRISCNLTLHEAAQKSGISSKVIEEIEAGKKDIKLKTVCKLLKLYGAKVDFSRKT